jgi:hypothetical protein
MILNLRHASKLQDRDSKEGIFSSYITDTESWLTVTAKELANIKKVIVTVRRSIIG